MAEKSKIQETQGSGFGQYQEGVGGGASPQPLKPGTHGHGVNSDHRKANNDTQQPRDNQGHFTYKSVNGQSINPKYGPSRGKTVNPLLTGGDGTIKISDVEQEFSAKSGSIWDKYKDKWYQKGSEFILQDGKKWKTHVAGETVWEVGKRRYDKVKGEFEKESSVFDEIKSGAPSKEEKTARQLAQSSGSEQAVLDNSGAIKVKPGTVPLKPIKKEEPKKKETSPIFSSSTGWKDVVPTEEQISEETEEKKFGTGKYSWNEGDSVRSYLKEMLGDNYDPMFDDDVVLEEFIDANGGKEIFKEIEAEKKPESKPEKENPIEKLGFSE
ncbi:MAG: hypothetical protein K5765_06880 [Clostridia bacterium]|nr:hypothetical protein [Clostridia bacterium]